MTKEELAQKVNVTPVGSGQYEVEIDYRGKTYLCRSNNALAYDSLPKYCNNCGCWNDTDTPMTEKQALRAFYDECKRKNNL